MISKIKVQNGPFKGHGPLDGEIVQALSDGVPILRNGHYVYYWPVHHQTRHVLEVYPPADGWCITIESDLGSFRLPQWRQNAQGGWDELSQPTASFTATLVSPLGHVVASASALKMIDGTTAWEAGETKARSRLYKVIGLTTTLDAEDGAFPSDAPPTEPTTSAEAVATAMPPRKDPGFNKLAPEALEVIDACVHVPDTSGKGTDHASADPKPTPDAPETAPETAHAKTASKSKSKRRAKTAAKAAEPENDAEAVQDTSSPDADAAAPDLNLNLVNQVKHRAKLANVAVPEVSSNDELRAFMKKLLKGEV